MLRSARWAGLVVFSTSVGCGSSAQNTQAPKGGLPDTDASTIVSGGGDSSTTMGSPYVDGSTPVGNGVTISPKSVALQPSGTQPFTCAVTGNPSGTCTYSVSEAGGGTVDAKGVYTAPATVGTYHVVATNAANASQGDTATVVVRVPAAGGCNALGTTGQWQSITPPAVPLPGPMPCNYGTLAFVVDPSNPSSIYLGTCQQGIWKSSDCGSNWTHVDTGKNANQIDGSRQWTFVIDPIDTQTLYTNAGYNVVDGNHSGAFKSVNGGVDWSEIWPPADGSLANIVTNNFVAQINIDPTNHDHLLMGFHQVCAAPYTSLCYGETRDGGTTWTLHNADSRWGSSESQTPYIINDQTWLFANHDSTGGLWVTTNGGGTWTLIAPNSAGHWPGQLYHATSGWYIGSDQGIFRSMDTVNWSLVANSGSLVTGLVGDGTTMWAASYGSYEPWVTGGTNPYMTSPESDGSTWTAATWTTPQGFAFTQGGLMAYDQVRHIVYSSNGTQGFWRVVVK